MRVPQMVHGRRKKSLKMQYYLYSRTSRIRRAPFVLKMCALVATENLTCVRSLKHSASQMSAIASGLSKRLVQ